ncbi:trigger factor [bacterium SCSIO 12696]|nr:trigger factor [bacterium SCSIO 12696]
MQVSIETTSGLERRLTVEVPADRIDSAVDARLQKEAKTIKMNGFRKGKVPFKVVKQRYGKYVRQEVMGEVVSQSFYEAVSQEKLRPAGQPSFEPVKGEEGEDLEYIATFEVYPEVALQDLSSVEVAKPVAEVEDADIEKMISVLREQQSSWSEVERAAAEGDQANIDFLGTKDGEEFAGGKGEGYNLVLGSNQMIPGFEDAIVGLSAGEEKTVPLSFPEDYHAEELKGADVEFAIKVNSVSERQLAELNDEFFAAYGVSEGGEDKFREEVRSNMERELKNAVNNKVKTRVMNQLAELHQVELPKALVTGEIQGLKQQMLQQYGGGQQQNIDLSVLPDDMFQAQAERRVTLGLIVAEVVKANEIVADPDRVRAQVEEIASTYEEPAQVVEYYYANPQLLDGIQSAVLEEQVVEHILDSAKVTEDKVSYEDALKPDAEPVAEEKSED